MKKEKENYERPSMEVIDVRLEGALCGSGDTPGVNDTEDGNTKDGIW